EEVFDDRCTISICDFVSILNSFSFDSFNIKNKLFTIVINNDCISRLYFLCNNKLRNRILNELLNGSLEWTCTIYRIKSGPYYLFYSTICGREANLLLFK